MARHLEAHEAELAVLGGVLLDNRAFDEIEGVVSPPDFYAPHHRIVFEQMQALRHAQQPIDTITLIAGLEQSGQLEQIGGHDFVLALNTVSATAVNIEHHARMVRQNADVRRLISACAGVIEKAQSGDYDDVSVLFDEAQSSVLELGQGRTRAEFMRMNAVLTAVVERVQKAYEEKRDLTGLDTGFHKLNELTAGLQPGELIILAARPGMGKTALALNLATNAARLGTTSVAVFSLEMPTVQLGGRVLSSEAGVEGPRMRSGFLLPEDIEKLLHHHGLLERLPLFIDDTPAISVMEVRAKCRRLHADESCPPLGLVVIDYLQLMKGPPGITSREQEISSISRNLKALAKELNLPVVALSQLNRGVESRPDKRPLMSDLRESGAIEQDADIIMFVYRDEYYRKEETEFPGQAEVILAKNRSGRTDKFMLSFQGKYTRFANLATDDH